MNLRKLIDARWFKAGIAMVIATISAPARAQTDEIQVYDAGIASPGHFNLTWHNNYIADGRRRSPEFSGGIAPRHTFSGVTEWAYGVSPWFEGGLYFPLYSIAGTGAATFNGAKLRALFVAPDAADRRFVYGVNFEFSWNSAHWDENRYTQEIRPIIGWHLGAFDVIINPILDNSYHGFGALVFAPATRVAYNLDKHWALAIEEYADFGPLRKFLPTSQQQQQLFAVFDRSDGRGGWEIEGGIGLGLTSATDSLTVKLILSRDLN